MTENGQSGITEVATAGFFECPYCGGTLLYSGVTDGNGDYGTELCDEYQCEHCDFVQTRNCIDLMDDLD